MSYGYGASMTHADSSSSANRRVEASATTSEKKGCRKFKKGSRRRMQCLMKKRAKRAAKAQKKKASILLQRSPSGQNPYRTYVTARKRAGKRQQARRKAYLARQKAARRARGRGRRVSATPQTFYSPYTPETTAAYTAETAAAVASYDYTTPSYMTGLEDAALAAEGIEPEAEVLPGEEEFEGSDYDDYEDNSMLLYAGLAAAAAGAYWFFRVRK